MVQVGGPRPVWLQRHQWQLQTADTDTWTFAFLPGCLYDWMSMVIWLAKHHHY